MHVREHAEHTYSVHVRCESLFYWMFEGSELEAIHVVAASLM